MAEDNKKLDQKMLKKISATGNHSQTSAKAENKKFNEELRNIEANAIVSGGFPEFPDNK
jgi:hypothetical protein